MSANIARTSATGEPEDRAPLRQGTGSRMVRIAIVAAALALALLLGWLPHYTRNKEINARAEQQRNALPVVEIEIAHTAGAEQELTLPGTVTPLRSAHIYARASGYLKARYVDLGDRVRRGQLLGVISAPDLDAGVAQQTALVQQSKENVITAQSALQLQQATYARVHTLVLHGILSAQDDDAARAAVESAQSNMEAMQSAVKAAQEALAREQALADFEQIRSPIDGTITARNVEIGNLVSASGAAQGLVANSVTGGPPTGGAQGGELFDVVDLGSLEVFVSVPEQDAPFVETGQPANLIFSEFPAETFQGRVVRSSDSLSQQTRTLLAELQVGDAGHRLRPGMFASVRMHYRAAAPAIVIPGDSLLTMARGQFVPVVENNVIQMRPVQVGRDLGTQVYITAGLRDGDRIVVNPNDAVAQGAHVTTRPAPAGQQGVDAEPSGAGKSGNQGAQDR